MIRHCGPVRIVADDLTGALDAAAPFARPGQPVGLVLHATDIPDRRVLTISSESRDSSESEAMAATTRACDVVGMPIAGAQMLWFHKVDSVLRGHPFAATAAMMQYLDLPCSLFAPAFPAMGRITRGGLQLVRTEDHWAPAATSDIAAGLLAAGLRPCSDAVGQAAATNAIVVDASSVEDLDQAVARQTDRRVLWVGSRGLAEALAGPVVPVECPPLAIVVIGTSHPATRAQLAHAGARLAPAAGMGVIRPKPGECVIIDSVVDSGTPAMTRAAVRQAALRIDPAGLEGRSMFVTGGETLSVVLDAVGALSLDCLGEVGPGLPYSILRGGRLDGCSIISKSGGFGAPDLLGRYF